MKLVRENLYNFHKTGDVKSGLNIGIRVKITKWLDEMEVENYTINDDLSIDVAGSVDLQHKNLTEFPEFIHFGTIMGYFRCSWNNLISLRGSPKNVNSWFSCQGNKLKSLKGGPEYVKRSFNCCNNYKEFTEGDVRAVCNVKGRIYTDVQRMYNGCNFK